MFWLAEDPEECPFVGGGDACPVPILREEPLLSVTWWQGG